MRSPRRLVATVLAGAVAASGFASLASSPAAEAAPRPSSAASVAADDLGTAHAEFYLRPADGSLGSRLFVTAEPATGRIEIAVYYWDVEDDGDYLHVALGARSGETCDVERRIVVNPTDLSATTVHTAAGDPLPTADVPVPADWTSTVSRVESDPFDAVNCVEAGGYDGPNPTSPGPVIQSAPVRTLRPVTFGDRTDAYPASVQCPRTVAWNEPFELPVAQSAAPGEYPPAGVVPLPSHLSDFAFTVDEVQGASVGSSPTPPSDVDLWTDGPWEGAFVLNPDESEVDRVRMSGTIRVEDHVIDWVCRIPVSMPAPTDWTGDLTGTTWWTRSSASNSGIGPYEKHSTYQFLDTEWVYVDDEYVTPRAIPCTTAKPNSYTGCHRYYYDAEDELLQIDDRRAKRLPGGWDMPVPVAGIQYHGYLETRIVRPIVPGMRVRYAGSGLGGVRLELRPDGTYRQRTHRAVSTGRYRLNAQTQQLVLRRPGPDQRLDVALFYGIRDGKRRLFDIDTADRRLRYSRW